MSDAESQPEPVADAPEELSTTQPVDPQAIFSGASIAAMEADIEALMNDKMSQLDEMLEGLEQLVQKIEGDMDKIEEVSDPPQ